MHDNVTGLIRDPHENASSRLASMLGGGDVLSVRDHLSKDSLIMPRAYSVSGAIEAPREARRVCYPDSSD